MVRRWVLFGAVAVGACCAPGCSRERVRLPVEQGAEVYQWRHPVTPTEFLDHADHIFYQVSPPVGYAEGRRYSSDSFALNARLRWDDAVRPLRDAFVRLSEDHNAARISVREYEGRRAQLLDAMEQLLARKAELDVALADYESALAERAALESGLQAPLDSDLQQATATMQAAASNVNGLIAQARALVERLAQPPPPEAAGQ